MAIIESAPWLRTAPVRGGPGGTGTAPARAEAPATKTAR
jgi:hypothetical protein